MADNFPFDEDDELDGLFEFGLDGEPLSDLFELDGLPEEQRQMLLIGRTPESEFDKEFYSLFRHRENLMTQIFEMDDEDDETDEDE